MAHKDSGRGQPARPQNRLAEASSPYLLQHAHNPVDWRQWGPEAFEEARRRDVPILLSIGYSTCYWCHVMERESFENEDIGQEMSDKFVCIKLDREERPDVDDVYMAATLLLHGQGGWPMTVFLEPEKLRPFWCGTYFPPEPRGSVPGLPQVLEGMREAWDNQRDKVMSQAEAIAQAVREHLGVSAKPATLGSRQVADAAGVLLRSFDRTHGGFGGAPKFPQGPNLRFLAEVVGIAGDDATGRAIDHALRFTLDKICAGGVYDHLGGGLHRYAVDGHWTVPHFEKMLYDNALLLEVLAITASEHNDAFHASAAHGIIDYVLREMTGPEGGFYSAQDAEVDGREGLNYLWTAEEIEAALGEDDASFAKRVFGVDKGPNFQDPHHPSDDAKSVLRLADRPEHVARETGLSEPDFLARLSSVKAALLDARSRREAPGTDDKIIASWNGMMILAMVRAGELLERPEAIDAAERAAAFVVETMAPGGRLHRTWRGGRLGPAGFLEDYGAMVSALAALHAAGRGDGRWLGAAQDLRAEAMRRFASPEAPGVLFDAEPEASELFVRTRTTHDGATPCGTSLMLNALIDLAEAADDAEPLNDAIALLESVSRAVRDNPASTINATRALLRLLQTEASKAAPHLFAEPDDQQEPDFIEPEADFTPVEIYAETERVSVGPERPAIFKVVLRIKEGHHLLAADPGPEATDMGLTPTRVLVTGGKGIAAYADYPEGEPYRPPFAGEDAPEIRVYKGDVEFEVAVELEGEWEGTPVLALQFQACTDDACLKPSMLELDVAIDPEG